MINRNSEKRATKGDVDEKSEKVEAFKGKETEREVFVG